MHLQLQQPADDALFPRRRRWRRRLRMYYLGQWSACPFATDERTDVRWRYIMANASQRQLCIRPYGREHRAIESYEAPHYFAGSASNPRAFLFLYLSVSVSFCHSLYFSLPLSVSASLFLSVSLSLFQSMFQSSSLFLSASVSISLPRCLLCSTFCMNFRHHHIIFY